MLMDPSWEAQRLVEFIRACPDFMMHAQIDGNYGHVGAILADAVLQSNNNYERNVRRRIARIRTEYVNYVRLSDLKCLLLTISVQEFLNWQGTRKPGIFRELIKLLSCEGLDSEEDLRNWLLLEESKEKLLAIRFIGKKTADYLKILVGLPNVAIDRHLLNFIELAGLGKLTYGLAHQLVHQAAQLMNINPSHLDHSIWRYMAGGNAMIEGGTKLPKLLTEPRPISAKARRRNEPCERRRHKPP